MGEDAVRIVVGSGNFLNGTHRLKAQLKQLIKRWKYSGTQRHCAVCGHSAREFLPFGVDPRPDARCPFCNCVERHRFVLLFLRERTDLFGGGPRRMLHIAPEKAFVPIFSRAAGAGYLTADLENESVMEKMDITDIKHPDNSFDIIFCSHVLEHVPDDRKAMREFFRTLKPGGWAILNVPVTADVTFEDPSVTSPEERQRLFGQHDHVRRYGPDYADRLKEAGFKVRCITPADILSREEMIRQGLTNPATGDIYFCEKEPGTTEPMPALDQGNRPG